MALPAATTPVDLKGVNLPELAPSRQKDPQMFGLAYQLVRLSRTGNGAPIAAITYVAVGDLLGKLEHRIERDKGTGKITEKRQRPSTWRIQRFESPDDVVTALGTDMHQVLETSQDFTMMTTAPYVVPYNATDVRNLSSSKIPHWSLHHVHEVFAAIRQHLMTPAEDSEPAGAAPIPFSPASSDAAGVTDELFNRLMEMGSTKEAKL